MMARSKEAIRGAMAGLHDTGLSVREIGGELGVPKSSVQRWTSRYAVSQPLTDRPRPRAKSGNNAQASCANGGYVHKCTLNEAGRYGHD